MSYSVILADPPWSYDDKCLHRGGALRHYSTMTLQDICDLPVRQLAAENCALFMWATFLKLFEAKAVFDAWGFEYKTCAFVWIKTNKRMNLDQASFFPVDSFDSFWGMGRWTRSNAEICLLGVRGQPKRASGGGDRIVELCGDVPRVELFARQATEGWSIWGNEVESTVELIA